MTNKTLKYFGSVLAILVISVLSLDIGRLDSARVRPASEVFDIETYVTNLWENHLPERIEKALEISTLLRMLEDDPDKAFEDHSVSLGISNTHYFFTRGGGLIEIKGEEYVTIVTDNNIPVQIETVYIFGNAIREGSGLVNIDDFLNMMDFNMVSVYLNRKARAKIVDPFRNKAEPGMRLEFTGAVEINRLEMPTGPLRVIPVQIELDYGDQ
jgi:predicted lipoprotein